MRINRIGDGNAICTRYIWRVVELRNSSTCQISMFIATSVKKCHSSCIPRSGLFFSSSLSLPFTRIRSHPIHPLSPACLWPTFLPRFSTDPTHPFSLKLPQPLYPTLSYSFSLSLFVAFVFLHFLFFCIQATEENTLDFIRSTKCN